MDEDRYAEISKTLMKWEPEDEDDLVQVIGAGKDSYEVLNLGECFLIGELSFGRIRRATEGAEFKKGSLILFSKYDEGSGEYRIYMPDALAMIEFFVSGQLRRVHFIIKIYNGWLSVQYQDSDSATDGFDVLHIRESDKAYRRIISILVKARVKSWNSCYFPKEPIWDGMSWSVLYWERKERLYYIKGYHERPERFKYISVLIELIEKLS